MLPHLNLDSALGEAIRAVINLYLRCEWYYTCTYDSDINH